MSTEVKVLSTSTRTNLKLPEVKQAILDFYEAEERRMETKTIEELQRLSDEKLKQLALQRHKGGRRKSTTTALRAQLVLWRRAGKPFQSEAHWVRNQSETGVHF